MNNESKMSLKDKCLSSIQNIFIMTIKLINSVLFILNGEKLSAKEKEIIKELINIKLKRIK